MKHDLKKLPTLLLVTQKPKVLSFFEGLKGEIDDLVLIPSRSEQDALDDLKRHPISLIVVDEKIPNIDLPALCEKIRAFSEYSHTPILIITGHLKKSFIRPLIKAGATDFLTEPLDKDECLMRIEIAKETKKTAQKMKALTPKFDSRAPEKATLNTKSIIDNRLVMVIEAALKEKSELTMVMLEIPNSSGEEMTERIEPLIREQDLLIPQKEGRYVIVLPKTSKRAAEFIVENLCDALIAGSSLTLSSSLVTLAEDGNQEKPASYNLERLVQAATDRLKNGDNR